MKHFTHIRDLGPAGVADVIERAAQWKAAAPGPVFSGKVLGMVFFNPSLRTRASFETVMYRQGGSSVVLEVGGGVWKLEERDGAVMNDDKAEHVREAAPVLSRYVEALAVRTFGRLVDDDEDEADRTLLAFRRHATVPVVSMESAREHPCQGLADVLTLRERLGDLKKKPVALVWAPHIKVLPKAVPHSFLLTAAAAGLDIRVAHPPGFDLHPSVVAEAQGYAAATGGNVAFYDRPEAAVDGAVAVYAKSWGPAGATLIDAKAAAAEVKSHASWLTTRRLLDRAHPGAPFLHCLPVRRNVEVADDVLDHPTAAVIDQAENRYHVQRAVLHHVWF